MSYFGYFDYLPAEQGNPWFEEDCPTDEEIEAMTKDEYKKGPGRADNRPGREKICKTILPQRSVAK